MEETRRNSSIISKGSLTFTDEYTEIKGDVDIREMIFEGDVKIFGNVDADRIKVKGNLEITGNLNAHELDADGEITIEGSAKVSDMWGDNIYVKGNITSDLEIEAGTMIVGGALKANIVSLGEDKGESVEDVLLVEGETNIEEALYVNEKEVTLL